MLEKFKKLNYSILYVLFEGYYLAISNYYSNLAVNKKEHKMDTKEKIKQFFLLAQELQGLATEGEDDFFKKVKEAESELDPEEQFILEDVVRFSSDLEDAISHGYTNLIDYWDD